MPSSITLCYTPTHTSNRCCLKSFTSSTFCGRLVAPDFVIKCTDARSLTILHFPTAGANDAQNVSIDAAHGKHNDQQNLEKMIM